MKITLTDENGKSIQLNIAYEEYLKLFPAVKKTGYERVETKQAYYVVFGNSSVESLTESYGTFADKYYIAADYYSDKTVAENNARADKLMRQLRRFAVEHREKELDWEKSSYKVYIYFNHVRKEITISQTDANQTVGTVHFDTIQNARLAIDTFEDELLWYFTEYKDSL